MSLNLESVSLKLDNRQILKDVSLEINEGEIVSVIGPNGAGKSTLLNVLTGDINPDSGKIVYDNKQLKQISFQERAFTRSVMSQMQTLVFNFSVKDVIEMGLKMFLKSAMCISLFIGNSIVFLEVSKEEFILLGRYFNSGVPLNPMILDTYCSMSLLQI